MMHEVFAAKQPYPLKLYRIDQHQHLSRDRHQEPSADHHPHVTSQVRLPSIYVSRLDALRLSSQTPQEPTINTNQQLVDAREPLIIEVTTKGQSRRKKKVPKHLMREANEKEMDSFAKRILKILLDTPFDEACYTHRIWMFFRESKESEKDIERMFHHIREKMKQKLILKKKSDPEKFLILFLVKGHDYPNALCDTSSLISIILGAMADYLSLKVEPSSDSFTFVDFSKVNSGGIVRDLQVQIGNTLVPVDFHVMDIQIDWNSSMLLGRAFKATVRAVCNMQTNQLCLTLIDQNVYYDPMRVLKGQMSYIEIGDDPWLVAAFSVISIMRKMTAMEHR
ncbi:hypothetical protein N665_0067s0012 [Sinapis alba]|nr:hypothetical protein N665_0067s0012 [Sinapis alba]